MKHIFGSIMKHIFGSTMRATCLVVEQKVFGLKVSDDVVNNRGFGC